MRLQTQGLGALRLENPQLPQSVRASDASVMFKYRELLINLFISYLIIGLVNFMLLLFFYGLQPVVVFNWRIIQFSGVYAQGIPDRA